MPCKSDYLKPTEREEYMRLTAQLLTWVTRTMGGIDPGKHVLAQAENLYAEDVGQVQMLCEILTCLTRESRDKLIYGNAKHVEARRLADWWEAHEAKDKAQQKREGDEQTRMQLIAQAKSKLTPEELKALLGE